MNDSTQPKRNIPQWAAIGAGTVVLLLLLVRCIGGDAEEIDISTATCESLIPHVIAMSQGKDPEILEITNPTRAGGRHGGAQEVPCDGQAEWSRREGSITYGAYVSDGGQVMLEYKQD